MSQLKGGSTLFTAAVHGGSAAAVRRLPDRRDVLGALRGAAGARLDAVRPRPPRHRPRQRPPPRLRPRHRTPHARHHAGM